jgi:ABC-type glycerol-3-phosphate transport system substrate-binding protein
MKTTPHLRMYIIAALMTASACSEPEVVPTNKTGGTSSSQISNREFHTTVTTWSRPDGSNYVGLVQSVPAFDLSKSRITAVGNGKNIKVDTFLDETKLTNTGSNEDYFWASVQNNILLLHYVGATPTSLPPFPLDVTIVY